MEEKQKLEEYKKKIDSLQRVVQRLQEKNQALKDEQQELKSALKDKIMDERQGILKISRQQLKTYFSIRANDYKDRLTALEDEVQEKLDRLKEKADVRLADERDEIETKISTLEKEVKQQIKQRKEEFAEQKDELLESYLEGAEQLKEREITKRTIEQRKQHDKLEEQVGISLLNILGVGLILLGLGTAYRYAVINWLTGFSAGASFLLVSSLLFASAEWFYRREKKEINYNLVAGGLLTIYAGLVYSYFSLQLIEIKLAVGLILAVIAGCFWLAQRYQFEPLFIIGGGGAYLSLYFYISLVGGLPANAVYWGGMYLIAVTSLILAGAWYQQWKLTIYVSFILNLPWLIYLVNTEVNGGSLVYILLMMGLYLGTVVSYQHYYDLKLKLFDFILLAADLIINTAVFILLVNNYLGLAVLSFGLVYLGLNQLFKKLFFQEERLNLLVQVPGIILITLAVPRLIVEGWWGVVWLGEAVVLMILGAYSQDKLYKMSGWVLIAASSIFFYAVSVRREMLEPGSIQFMIKYILLNSGLIISLLFNFRTEDSSRLQAVNYLKYFTIISLWGSWLYFVFKLSGHVLFGGLSVFYKLSLLVLGQLMLCYLLIRIDWLADKKVEKFIGGLCLVSGGLVQYLNWSQPLLARAESFLQVYTNLGLLILLNGLILFTLTKLGQRGLNYWRYGLQLQLVGLGIWLVGLITSLWLIQLQLPADSLVFSLLYLGLAGGFIGYGFYRQVSYLRILGLVAAVMGLGKLLLVDLVDLNTVGKIFIYLGSGVILVLTAINYHQLKRIIKNYLREHLQI